MPTHKTLGKNDETKNDIVESKPCFGKEGQIRQEHLRESHSQIDVRATQTSGQS